MKLAGEIADFARNHFEEPHVSLDAASDLVAIFSARDPDWFTDFLVAISRHYRVRQPKSTLYVDSLTLGELCEIIEAGQWPEEQFKQADKP